MLSLPQRALLQLLKIAIGTEQEKFDFSLLSPSDWEKVVRESRVQSVSLICFDAVTKYKQYIPENVYSSWLKTSAQGIAHNLNVLNSQNELVEILDKNNFSYIILKGFAAASYYPDYEKRMFGDVDFLVSPKQQKQVESALLDAGYQMSMDEHICHRVFKKPNSNLEMHFEVAGMPDGDAGKLFSEYLENATEKYALNPKPAFHNPIPQIHAVVVLLHTIHHMLCEGLGLRHLCDWACFVDRTHTETFWNDEILPLLNKTGTLKFAAVLTKTASLYLGTICPEWAENADAELCNDVISDIFLSGNFGVKDKDRSGAGRIISPNAKTSSKNSKIKNQIRTLADTMYSAYPFLRRFKVLYPFVFVWRIIKYLVLMLQGKRPSIVKANRYADERMLIYKQFELYKSTEE